MRGWSQCVAAGLVMSAVAIASTACTSSSSGDSQTVTLDQLRKATDTCPLPLDDAVDAADPSASTMTSSPGSLAPPVSVTTSADAGSALDRIGGVSVECTTVVGAGAVTVLLIAATKGASEPRAAAATLLPTVANYGGLSSSAIQAVANRAAKTEPGHAVPLGTGVTAALGIVTIGGARSAAFAVYSKGSVSASTIQAIGKSLAERLG